MLWVFPTPMQLGFIPLLALVEGSKNAHWLGRLIISDHAATNVLAEISGMKYGLPIDAIIGSDVLQSIGAIIRMGPLLIEFEE